MDSRAADTTGDATTRPIGPVVDDEVRIARREARRAAREAGTPLPPRHFKKEQPQRRKRPPIEPPNDFPVDPVTNYAFATRRGAESRDLVLMFSPSSRFNLLSHDFGRDVIYVAEQKPRYYLRRARELARSLLSAIERGGYDRVLFCGTSKGATGALSLARICAGLQPNRRFHALSFHPQTQLWPYNPRLGFRSYQGLFSDARKDLWLALNLRRFGDLSLVGDAPNLRSVVVYARDAVRDRIEAKRIVGPNVTLRVVAGATHAAMFQFLSHDKSREEVLTALRRLYETNSDPDVEATRPDDIEAVADEIVAAALVEPRLNDLMSEALALTPVRPPFADRFGRAARRSSERMKLSLIGPKWRRSQT